MVEIRAKDEGDSKPDVIAMEQRQGLTAGDSGGKGSVLDSSRTGENRTGDRRGGNDIRTAVVLEVDRTVDTLAPTSRPTVSCRVALRCGSLEASRHERTTTSESGSEW